MFDRKYFIPAIGKNRMADYLSVILYDARCMTFTYIKGITQAELDWQPFDGWNTVGALLSHIVAAENYFRIKFLEGRELSEEEKSILPAIELGKNVNKLKGRSPKYYHAELLAAHNAMKKVVQNMPDEKLLHARYDMYDYVNGCNLAWILYHGAEDEVHHRGQISIIRKLYKKRKGGNL